MTREERLELEKLSILCWGNKSRYRHYMKNGVPYKDANGMRRKKWLINNEQVTHFMKEIIRQRTELLEELKGGNKKRSEETKDVSNTVEVANGNS